jgi:hypothetical protein
VLAIVAADANDFSGALSPGWHLSKSPVEVGWLQ